MSGFEQFVDLQMEQDPAAKMVLTAKLFLESTNFAGLAITYRANAAGDHDFVFATGYRDEALSHLRSRFVTSHPLYRRAVDDSSMITWRDGHFGEGEVARHWLRPEGYRNGFSIPIFSTGSGEVGSVHANSYAPEFADVQLRQACALRDYVSVLMHQHRFQADTKLTSRELHVMRMVAQDATNIDIAEVLSVSRSTVATHIENIIRKLAVRSRVGIAVAASQMGII